MVRGTGECALMRKVGSRTHECVVRRRCKDRPLPIHFLKLCAVSETSAFVFTASWIMTHFLERRCSRPLVAGCRPGISASATLSETINTGAVRRSHSLGISQEPAVLSM
ncbi:hypothetical protein MAPG_10598 [Magnaporthiopsis poae ATCC 64411]|uniref:Uncharacterized protein n=1 Tax=Magnaporthiopsis poae (strain ATCC 64411 / 73-15) TaxID=644358 RepID=A0A0C4ED07_MAGP6|nr:hypothetical protein MAPG_10598 [Magnaporthiopsis poae ATCC 64411]